MTDKTINTDVTMRDATPAGGAKRFRAGDEILGRYVVESELGQGGMGVVYLCLDKVGGIKVAVKGLPPEVSHNSDEMESVSTGTAYSGKGSSSAGRSVAGRCSSVS